MQCSAVAATATRRVFSIIVPVYNQAAYTRACLESLQACTDTPYHLLIIDNASSDDTPALLADYQARGWPLEVISNDRNVGFTAAANQGLRQARGDCVVLLNNDTTVTPGWLSGLRRTAESDDRIGVVGPRLLDPKTDLLQGLGGLVFHRRGVTAPLGQGRPADDPELQGTVDCQYVEGSCLLITRRAVDRLGYLDEVFSPGYYEDVDYCFRAREAGFRVVCSPHSRVYHHVNVTARAVNRESPALTRAAARNERLFRERWSHRFAD